MRAPRVTPARFSPRDFARIGYAGVGCALALVGAAASSADAQALGTFTWQLQPYCNVVTVNVIQQGAVYTIDGYDDQCGAPQRAPLTGVATPNPDGTIGFGLNVVTAPGGRGVQIEARIALPAGSGPWTDSAGNSGTFALAARTGGNPRPAAAATVPSAIHLLADGGLLAGGTFGTGAIPATGSGARMMWHPRKSAFRAGTAQLSEWDDANIGVYSTAFGNGTTASGDSSTAMGIQTKAIGFGSTAFGASSTATGSYSVAGGYNTKANGTASTAFGVNTMATGAQSTALGSISWASGAYSTAMGYFNLASGDVSTALGDSTIAAGYGATTMGALAQATAAAPGSFVFGDRSTIGQGNGLVTSISPNQFLVRAAGGTVFWSTAATTYPTSPGVILFSGDSSWSSLSDVNAKENFRDLAHDDVLARIAAMPVREWNYKAQDQAIRHLGPTAQDFHAAFGLGQDERRISTLDADGVALAGIQALEARTRADHDTLQRENEALRARLARLEQLLIDRK